MQIQTITKDELALLIHGLRAIHVSDMEITRAKLQKQLEAELSQRFQMKLREPA